MGNTHSAEEFNKRLAELKDRRIDINDHAFWSALFTQKMYHGDLFDFVPERDILYLRTRRPENLAMLLFKCIDQVLLFSRERSFYKTEGEKSYAASTALTLLAKVLPNILYRLDPAEYFPNKSQRAQVSEYAQDFAMHVLVNNLMCVKESQAVLSNAVPSAAAAAANDGDDDDDHQQHAGAAASTTTTEAHLVFPYLEEQRPLGDTMMRAIAAVAFVPGFTVAKHQWAKEKDAERPRPLSEEHKTHYPFVTHPEIVWIPGVAAGHGDTGTIEQSDQCDINRSLVVRTLLAACSSQAYASSGNVPARLRYLLNDPAECPMGPHVAASLLNEVSSYWPFGTLPYTSHFVWQRETLVAESMQLLTVLLDTSVFHQEVLVHVDKKGNEVQPGSKAAVGTVVRIVHPDQAMNAHALWSLVNNMTEKHCHDFCHSFLHLLQNNAYSRMTYLPGSQKSLHFRDECFIVLWKMLYKSAHFRKLFCKSETLCRRVVVPIVTLLVDAIEANDARASMLQLAIMMLETLSMERDFALALNEPFVEYVPFKLPAWQGTYFDLVVYAAHQAIACRSRAALSMHHAALSTVANLAPCATSWSMLSAMKLLNLFENFAKKDVLDARKYPDHMLSVLVYVLASAVQYQFHGAAHVAYSLLRRAKQVRELWDYVKAHSVAAEGVVDGASDAEDEEEEEEQEAETAAAAAAAASTGDKSSAPAADKPAASAATSTKPKRARFSRTVLAHVFTLKCTVEALEGSVHKRLEEDPNFDVHTLLQGVTLVGKMPVPHPLLIHRVPESPEIDHWLTSVVWSTIHARPFRFLYVPAIRLFARPQPIRTDRSSSSEDDGDEEEDDATSSTSSDASKDDDDKEMKDKKAGKKADGSAAAPSATAAAVPMPEGRSPVR